eukprot:CAMPEP_0202091122 /NCGR_PEP_ID=MMETSP0964-20121228/45193_1 /ASSEMBLY_ACC=CAM_ASM_000500 /TAXON_ID=4773 /ORGANISM="Schizochytrium aggregatum, Strain ATCC28209" /LENGTH=57 /DNA_ID=CAMNT_0048659301 /DNA_START=20 /DNA_END=190 /DNA_ORIENTATION=+
MALEGMTFTVTGTLSVRRADFEALLREHGGGVAKSVTKAVTHLVSAMPGSSEPTAKE